MGAVKREVAFLKQHIIIVRFACDLPQSFRHELWIRDLEFLIRARVALHRDAGGGFHFIKLDSVDVARQVLALSPCHLKGGTAIFQRWIPRFNPYQLVGLKVPC